jgi:hypothetical protein
MSPQKSKISFLKLSIQQHGSTAARQRGSTAAPQHGSTAAPQHGSTGSLINLFPY